MNSKTCVNCQKNCEIRENEGFVFADCGHKICKACESQSEKPFICPVDGTKSFLNARKSGSLRPVECGKRGESMRNEDNNILRYLDQQTPNMSNENSVDGPEINAKNETGKYQTESRYANELSESTKNQKQNVGHQKKRSLRRCEFHPKQDLDIVCLNGKCQMYVCLECVAFGNHSVG